MAQFGFSSITNPAVLKTAGRVMTLPKGAAMKGKDLEEIKAELAKRATLSSTDAACPRAGEPSKRIYLVKIGILPLGRSV